MKMQYTGCYFLLFLYLGVLLHNTIPHVHTEEGKQMESQHHHSSDAKHHTHHSEGSEEHNSENSSIPLDLSSLLAHSDLGSGHFNNFIGASFHFIPLLLIALWLLSSLRRFLPPSKIAKPPERPDQQLQRLTLSAVSHRGPPSFS
ncbi:MAG: hypothetical protein RIG62_05415 [Cyclobacteriaceae bacterium]